MPFSNHPLLNDPARGFAGKLVPQWRQLLMALLIAVLSLQMMGAGWHDHDLIEPDTDCVSCYVNAHFPSSLPVPAPAVLAIFSLFMVVPVLHLPASLHITNTCLNPPSRAPPVY